MFFEVFPKVETNINVKIYIYDPVKDSNDTTLQVDIKKNTIIEQLGRKDTMMLDGWEEIEDHLILIRRNITSPFDAFQVDLDRKIPMEDLSILKKDFMPGFRLTWSFNKEVQKWPKFRKNWLTKEFVR